MLDHSLACPIQFLIVKRMYIVLYVYIYIPAVTATHRERKKKKNNEILFKHEKTFTLNKIPNKIK